jgi:uncharacterized repeat protein (TIGR01451 family)
MGKTPATLGVPKYRQLLIAALAYCTMSAWGCCSGRRLMIDQTGERIFTWGPVEYAPQPRPAYEGRHQKVGVAVIPADVIAPPGSEVVLLAAVRGTDGYLHANQQVEWTLAPGGVGQFVGLGQRSPLDWLVGFNHRPRKISSTYAIGATSSRYVCLHRGTPSAGDDVKVERGQAWISVSSPFEGTSFVTAYAPEVARWDTHQRTATIHWVDAECAFPPPAVNPTGTRHTFTTTVTRHTTRAPVAGWRVRYEISGGPPAGFSPDGAQVVELTTNELGQASVDIEQSGAVPGTNSVAIQVIRLDAAASDGQRLVVGAGSTSKTWSSPDVSIRKTGPPQASVGDTLKYTIEVRNPGSVTSKEVTVTDQLGDGLTYLGSTPEANVSAGRLEWRLGDLQAGQGRSIEVQLRADKPGMVNNCASVTTDEGRNAQDCAATTVLSQTLDIAITGPTQAAVGQDVTFEARITNRSGAALRGLTLVDRHDEALDPQGVQRTDDAKPGVIESDLGDLGPGESGRVSVTFRVTQSGKLCHTIEVQSASGTLASARACLTATGAGGAAAGPPPTVSVKKTGPARVEVGQKAVFDIVVTNTGETTATNLSVVDHYDEAFRPTQTSVGFFWQGRDLSWTVDRLSPGKSVSKRVVGVCLEPSSRSCNQVSVSSQEGARAGAEACVEFVTPDGLAVLVSEVPDFAHVGERSIYRVSVTNYAKSADRNVALVMTFPDGITPSNDGTGGETRFAIDGQHVRFDPVLEIGPGETLNYTVGATAERAGDFNCRVEVTSQRFRQPVVAEESTSVVE